MRESAARFARIRDAWRTLKADDGTPSQSGSGRAPLKPADEIVQRIRTHMQNDLRTDMAVEELEALAGLTMARGESWTAAEREAAKAAWAEASKMMGILDDYPERLRSEAPGDDCDC
jgi:cysteinyl-tRNA synthetase